MTTTDSSDAIVVTTTVADQGSADALALLLVDARVAACVQVVPGIASVYRWQDAIRRDAEVLLVVKTIAARRDALVALLREHHPYDVPEIVVLPASYVSNDYQAWLVESTSNVAAHSE